MRPCHISSAKHVPYRCFGFCASHMVIKCLLFVIIHNMSIRVSMREFVHCSLCLPYEHYGSFKKRALYFFCRSFCKYLSMCRFYRTLSTMIMLFCVTFFHHTLVTLFHTSLYVLNNCRAALFFFSAVVESKTE